MSQRTTGPYQLYPRFFDNLVYPTLTRLFRRRRMQTFVRHFRLSSDTRLLDIGGTPYNWHLLPAGAPRPRTTFLNVYAPPPEASENAAGASQQPAWVVGDGATLPFADQSFAIVYSNSVIEHLGTWQRQQQFAAECRRVGRSYYVQTPDRRFPFEPHLLTPFIHWLPRSWQRPLLRVATVWGWINRPTAAEADALWHELRLLDAAEMRRLFPEADLWRERLGGLPKSLIAVWLEPET